MDMQYVFSEGLRIRHMEETMIDMMSDMRSSNVAGEPISDTCIERFSAAMKALGVGEGEAHDD